MPQTRRRRRRHHHRLAAVSDAAEFGGGTQPLIYVLSKFTNYFDQTRVIPQVFPKLRPTVVHVLAMAPGTT